MPSLTKKKISGKIYYYARECQRVEGRPKIVWQKYLGRLEDILAALEARRKGLPIPQPLAEGLVTELGAVGALYDLARRLRLLEIIDRHVPKRGSGPSVGTYLLVAAINRCVDPCSKARLAQWFEGTILRRCLPLESRQLSSQRYWDNMDRVSPQAISAIEAELTGHLVQEFHLDLSRLLFDATNFFTFIDSFNDRSTLAQRGKSKEGRAALRIVGLALMVSADFHVPLFHHTYPGNQTDAPTFAQLSLRLAERCKSLMQGVEHITWIFDKGNNSEDNLEIVADTPFHFIGSLVPTQHPRLLQIPRRRFRSLEKEGLPGVLVFRTDYEVFGTQRTVLVVYNENLFVAQARTLLREIAKRQQKLNELSQKLERWHRGEVRGGNPPRLESTRKKVDGWLEARHMKELFEVSLTKENELPVLRYQFLQSAWKQLQSTLLGISILFTDNADWTDAQIVSGYRSQYHIEDAFRTMKDPHCIALRPQFHWTDQKIRVHVFICVIALMLVSLLRRELHAKGFDLSIPAALELLAGIREMVMVFPPQEKGAEPSLRTSLTRMSTQQRQIFAALHLERYSSS